MPIVDRGEGRAEAGRTGGEAVTRVKEEEDVG